MLMVGVCTKYKKTGYTLERNNYLLEVRYKKNAPVNKSEREYGGGKYTFHLTLANGKLSTLGLRSLVKLCDSSKSDLERLILLKIKYKYAKYSYRSYSDLCFCERYEVVDGRTVVHLFWVDEDWFTLP